MDDLFTQEEISAGERISKVHLQYGRDIEYSYNPRTGCFVSVSGGDLPEGFEAIVSCDSEHINWIADALGRAPAPKP